MLNSIKALLVVVVVAAIIFRLGRPFALRFINERDFARRRNIWFALTIIGFLSPSFWLFALAATPMLIWGGRKDSHPFAFYVFLLHVIPPTSVEIPVVGINRLFSVDMYRLLSFFVLIPLAWRLRRSTTPTSPGRFGLMDGFLLAYGALQILLFVRPDTLDAASLHDSVTNVLRRAVLYFIDIYIVYFAASRSCRTRESLTDVLATFCLVCVVMAPIALFETARHWLLYAEMGRGWGGDLIDQYTDRAGAVRATVSSGHSLALGYLLALGTGFWLYLRTRFPSWKIRFAVMGLLWLGLLAAYSRGPWVCAVLIYFAFIALSPKAMSRMVKAVTISLIMAAAVLVSPLGQRVVNVVPFMGGKVDSYNIDYRNRLAHRSWEILSEHPYLGDQDAYAKLHDMRQGVGVIDFVNAYAQVAVFYGAIGLFLFVSFILVGLAKSYAACKSSRGSDSDFSLLGAALVSCILGTLVVIGTSSFMYGYEKMFYVMGGLAAAYASIPIAGNLRAPRAAPRALANPYA